MNKVLVCLLSSLPVLQAWALDVVDDSGRRVSLARPAERILTLAPHAAEWERAGEIPRTIFRRMGTLGYLGITVPPQYGGTGADLIMGGGGDDLLLGGPGNDLLVGDSTIEPDESDIGCDNRFVAVSPTEGGYKLRTDLSESTGD